MPWGNLTRGIREWARRRWPSVHLRTLLFLALFLVASLPGFAALFLRVYENTVVRQTEASVVAQAVAVGAIFAEAYAGMAPDASTGSDVPTLDLSALDPLPERRAGPVASADPLAVKAASAAGGIAAAISDATLASIRILDRNGVVVAGREDVGRSYADLEEVRRALAGDRATVLRRRSDYAPRYPLEFLSRAASVRIHHARPVVVDGAVIGAVLVSRSPRSLFRGIGDDLGHITLGIALIFGALLALTALLSRGIARPIERLGAASRAVATGGSQAMPDTPATAIIEIRALYEDFHAMARRIEWRNRYLRDFAAAISHEFKTPLSGIRGALELLIDHGEHMSLAERARFLANAAVDAERLSRLTGRLLELARADMAARQSGVSTDPEPILRRLADAFAGPDRQVRLAFDGPVPHIDCPAEVIETVFMTLMENSFQAGARLLTIDAALRSGRVVFGLQDDGPGIPPPDRDRLFEPFFTTRRDLGGTGLGLPIARALVGNSGGSIGLVTTGGGARFEIDLPIAI